MQKTPIEWTDVSWNPVTGCTKISQGCKNCYAEKIAERFRGTKTFPNGFDVTLHPERLEQPLHWRKPRRIFVNSMSDLFHEQVLDLFIRQVWAVMAACPQHTFQILTKRPERMAKVLGGGVYSIAAVDWFTSQFGLRAQPSEAWPLPNVWVGTSVEDQVSANTRIPWLLKAPAAVRFLSCEPLLGPITLSKLTAPWYEPGYATGREVYPLLGLMAIPDMDWEVGKLDWIIAGFESGPSARPGHPAWVRSIRDQCQVASVPFFFKQWGQYRPLPEPYGRLCGPGVPDTSRHGVAVDLDATWYDWDNHSMGDLSDEAWLMERVGKKRAGRLLDGRTWEEFPA